MVRGVKLCCRLARTEPLASVMLPNPDVRYNHNLADKTDSEIEAYVREQVQTLWVHCIALAACVILNPSLFDINARYHPTSTARMAPLSDGGVLDATLKPHGLTGLRVADASAFPTIVSGHTVRRICNPVAYDAQDL